MDRVDVIDYEDRMENCLIPCLSQLAVNVANEGLWKSLNHQVLQRTRSEFPLVRRTAVQVLQALYEKVGEAFLALVPESLQHFSELLEDTDTVVENLTIKLLNTLEKWLGKDLFKLGQD